ncbi:PhoH family protein [Effusibacillus lacus]|uniref:PhoH-like protein n=1 Tax=Effusibacillus lacus TaxID=1348429 RepID=A0A292YQQ4_9BACL|nr:PhoH family protein [Effusibacillus lacus]TCS70362.1 phosphate starvation-inducible PhoH-like protein [Effusibacillus lacus]GAX91516.1 PhoH family protein [Effusibacillus lacus]
MDTTTRKISLQSNQEAIQIFGPNDANLKQIEGHFSAKLVVRGGEILITGSQDEADTLAQLFDVLAQLVRKGTTIGEREIAYAIRMTQQGAGEELLELYTEDIAINAKGKPIRVKTLGQRFYIQDIRKKDIVFGVGPAGTGKTYLAVVMAVMALKKGHVSKIVLTRPAVEAGENLGFLPGDLQEKVDPYLRPLYDALYDMMGVEPVQKAMERGIIEVAPLAYMRGRTLEDSFVILDEAQNTTPEQMKMFLTRLGFGSKMVITGDITQIDLPRGKLSGLNEAIRVLKDIKEISFVFLTEQDVVRHHLVQKIISAYAREDEQTAAAPQNRK